MEVGQDTGVQAGLVDPIVGAKPVIETGVKYIQTSATAPSLDWKAEFRANLARIETKIHNLDADTRNGLLILEGVLLAKLAEISERIHTPWYKRLWNWMKGSPE